VAKATMMPVGDVQDSLAAEMEQGAAVFDLRWSKGQHVSSCKASRIGDPAVPCASDTYSRHLYS
jgi:hypothetical protein